MPTYTYQCKQCGWHGDRQCSIATRDKQRCKETHPKPTRMVCGAKLEREEIPADQARCSHNWSGWQR